MIIHCLIHQVLWTMRNLLALVLLVCASFWFYLEYTGQCANKGHGGRA